MLGKTNQDSGNINHFLSMYIRINAVVFFTRLSTTETNINWLFSWVKQAISNVIALWEIFHSFIIQEYDKNQSDKDTITNYLNKSTKILQIFS